MKKILYSIITIMLVMCVMVCNSGTVAYSVPAESDIQ